MNSADPTRPVLAPVPVAIIGMGCLFPRAEEGLARFWANIRNRLDAITDVPPTHWRVEDYFDADPKAPDRTYAHRGGFLAPVDFPALEFGIAPNNLEATDTTQLLGLLVARRALEDAGYGDGGPGARRLERDRVSVILGVTGTLELVIPLGARLGHPIWRRALKAAGVADDTAERVVRDIADSYVGWQENSFPGLLGNVAAGRIANRLDLGGTNCVIDAACASSLGALNLALLELASGRCDMALSGGLDTFNNIFMYMCFSKTPALSPTGDARPFDVACDGTILGEGLGILALKRLDDARRDGDQVYAVIKAVGASSDGKGNAVYAPSAAGQAKALRQAYALAGVSPATVELVEAHGTGTKVGDATELAVLNEVYREARPGGTWCALGSVKSQIGHTKAAAGAAGLIKAALALHRKVLPPTAKVTRPLDGVLPGASPFFVNTEARPWMLPAGHPRRAAVSSFGFGGSNFHCVLEEAGPAMPGIDWDGDVQIVAVSADSRGGLLRALDAWPERPAWEALRVEAARSRARFDPGEACRLLLVVDRERADPAGLRAKARALVAEGAKPAPDDGIYLGTGPAAGGLAMLFPGQGSQHVGMLRTLACQFPMMHEALAEADAAAPDDNPRLSDLIYPHPAFSEDDRARQEAALRATEVAQPALGAVSLGVLGILEHFGVRPDAVAGHSFGELSALCAAGRIDAGTLASLARLRGRLMADRAHPGDGGAMLAVMAPLDRVEAVVRDERLDVVVANKNAPRQAVLSGPAQEIARAARAFERLRVATQSLEVSAAFHSRFVAGARGPFLETLREVAFRPSRVPVFANTTAAPYPDDPDAARALLAGQLVAPVEFVAEVEAMYRSGLRTYLEVGPDARLTGLVAAILDGRPHAALAVDATRGRRGHVADLARALAQLAALGHPVRLPLWDAGVDHEAPVKKPTLTVKVCGANATPRPKPTPTGGPTPSSKARPDEPAGTCGVTGGDDIFASPGFPPTQPSPTRGEGLLSSASPGHEFPAGFEACATKGEGVLSPSSNQEFPAGFEVCVTKGAGVRIASSHLVGEDRGGGARQGPASRHHQATPMSQPGTRRAPEDGGHATAPESSPSKSARPAAANQAGTPSRLSSPPVAPTNGDIAAPHGRNGTHDELPMSPTSTNGIAPSSSPTDRLRHPVPPVPAPTPRPILRSGDPAFLEQALRAAQENLIALQKISEQTAQLHRQFLDGQDKTQRAFQSLLEQQQRLVLMGAPPTAALPQGPGSAVLRDPRHEPRQHDPRPAVEGARSPMPSDPDSLPEGPRTGSLPPVGSAARTDSGDDDTRAHAQDGPHGGPDDRLCSAPKGRPAESLGQGDVLSPLRGWNPYSSSEHADPGRASWATDCRPFRAQEHDPGQPFVDPRAVVGDAHPTKTEGGSAVRTNSVDEDAHAHAQDGPLCGPSEDLAPQSSSGWAPPTDPRAVQAVLLEVVAEKTGYPTEMLEPDMQLDADLGIDSIKRVEILSALQERLPEAPMIQPEHLGTLRTLRQIAEFLGQGASGSPIAPADSPESSMSLPALTLAPGRVQEVLLEVVAEKTGYPAEMLEPGMQLDADLGIDSIKRVEILSALQERLPETPAIQPEHLGKLQTLGQIVEFLASGPIPAPLETPQTAEVERDDLPSIPAPRAAGPLSVQRLVVSRVALDEGRREPVVVQAGGEFWILDDGTDLPPALASRLKGMGHRPRVVPPSELARLGSAARLDGLIVQAPASGDPDASLKNAFRLVRAAAPGLRRAARDGGAAFVTVSRLDGAFGLRGLAATVDPTCGGLAGLAKTAGHEWPEVACKAIDLDPAFGPADQAAAAILEEMFRRGPAEVGLAHDGRSAIAAVPAGLDRPGPAPLGSGDVVVITGGARGITAEVAVALAEAFRPTIVLLGRSPAPSLEPDWLVPLADEAEIKRALAARANGHASPQAISEQFRGVAANREIARNLRRIERAGARVAYRPVDVRDAGAVRACLDAVRDEFGPIRGLVHGAGVLADRRIEDQTDEQFAAVYDTKVAGLHGLLAATAGDDLRVLVLFSSSTARFGRTGQVAYASANEVLNKHAQHVVRSRPACRVVAVNWGPWDGGMVTPSLRPIFEAEGVPLIAPEAGARYLVEEIRDAGARPVEVVILGDPGATRTPDDQGRGNRQDVVPPGPAPSGQGVEVPARASGPAVAPVFERRVDESSLPVLRSHVIDGRPVLPMALILEWLALGATQRHPGLVLAGVDDLRLLKGVVLRDATPEPIRVLAGKLTRDGALYRVPVELRGAASDGCEREVMHARGEVVLADRHPQPEPTFELPSLPPYPLGKAALYRDVLFHGPDLQALERVEGCGDAGIVAWSATAPPPSAWIDRPPRQAWLSDPLALDAAFQMLIVWSVDRSGVASLPTYLGRYRQYRRAFPPGPIRIAARITHAGTHRARADVAFLAADGGLIARIDDHECVLDASLNQAFRRKQPTRAERR